MTVRVLHVEDDREHARLARQALAAETDPDFEVVTVETFREAQEALRGGAFHAVLLDLMLPDSHGFETLDGLLPLCDRSAVIVLTGVSAKEEGLRATRRGAHAYLAKAEMHLRSLPQVLLRAIERKRIQDALRATTARLAEANRRLREEMKARESVDRQLADRESFYRSVIDYQTEMVCRFDPDERLTFVNRAYAETFESTPEEMVGRLFLDCLSEKERVAHLRFLRDFRLDRPCGRQEYRVALPNGEARWQEWVGRAFFDAEGKVVGFQASGRDITERKAAEESRRAAEEELRASENRYRSLFDGSRDGIVFVDLEGRITEFNDSYAQMLGYGREELLGRHIGELTPRPIWEWERSVVIEQIRKRGYCESFEKQYIRKDGTQVPVEVSAYTLNNTRGELEHVLAIVRDVSARKRAEEALRNNEQRLLAIFNSTFQFMGLLQPDGRLIESNRTALDFGGVSAEEVQGAIFWETPWWQVSKRAQTRLRQAISRAAEGLLVRYETELRRADGENRTIDFSLKPIRDAAGSITMLLAEGRDITDLKRMERDGRQQQEQLAQASKLVSLGTLVSGVAHEINNPGNFILLNAPLLRNVWRDVQPFLDERFEKQGDFKLGGFRYSKLRENAEDLFQGIVDGGERIRNIVTELRNFARPDMSDYSERFNVNEAIKTSTFLMQNTLKKSTRHFTATTGSGIPPIRGSMQKIEQVLINLIQNACESLPDREAAVEVASSFDVAAGQVVVTVKDEGCGIRKADLDRVFDPFFTTKRGSGGTGLGLSITMQIVQNHRGTIEVQSSPGGGTVVTVRFPVSEEAWR